MWNPRWWPRNGYDGRWMVTILIMAIQVNFVPRPSGTKFTWIVVIKIFTINLPSQPFLGCHLGFHIFFHLAFLRAALFFYMQLGCVGLDFTSFFVLIPQSQPMASFGSFLTYLFFLYHRKKKKMKKILNTLTNSDFISKCTNYIILYLLHVNYSLQITYLQLIFLLGDLKCSWTLYRVICL